MADYEGVLADLKTRLTTIDRERREIEQTITSLARLIPTKQGHPQAVVAPKTFSTLTMPEALKKCLKLAQQPQTKPQIKDTLKAGGARVGKSFGAHVYNTLKRLSGPDGPFRRESDGRWSLREWPAMVSEPGNSGSATTAH